MEHRADLVPEADRDAVQRAVQEAQRTKGPLA
jgi:hypothetical protein